MELLVVMALGAAILGGVMVTFGTLMAGRTNISETVDITMQSGLAVNFYGNGAPSVRTIPVAPNYGALARAEQLREEFHRDAIGATAVFCLYRRSTQITNPLRYNWFAYDPASDGQIDSPLAFYNHLVKKHPSAATVFEVPANPGANNLAPLPHATVFLTSFVADQTRIGIIATYEVDVIRHATVQPWGFYASVRKYSHDPANPNSQNSAFSGGFEVFFQPSVRNPTSSAQFAGDGFSPTFVLFDRAVRRSVIEDSVVGQDRFKVAAENPFYFLWWPDPAMPNLESEKISGTPQQPRTAYNHMGGRTAFMFTVPVFPAL